MSMVFALHPIGQRAQLSSPPRCWCPASTTSWSTMDVLPPNTTRVVPITQAATKLAPQRVPRRIKLCGASLCNTAVARDSRIRPYALVLARFSWCIPYPPSSGALPCPASPSPAVACISSLCSGVPPHHNRNILRPPRHISLYPLAVPLLSPCCPLSPKATTPTPTQSRREGESNLSFVLPSPFLPFLARRRSSPPHTSLAVLASPPPISLVLVLVSYLAGLLLVQLSSRCRIGRNPLHISYTPHTSTHITHTHTRLASPLASPPAPCARRVLLAHGHAGAARCRLASSCFCLLSRCKFIPVALLAYHTRIYPLICAYLDTSPPRPRPRLAPHRRLPSSLPLAHSA